MEKIVIVTDTWFPKLDGIVISIQKTKKILEKRGFQVIIIHPGLFSTFSLFFYPELKIALFPSKKIKKILETEKPNYIHIATEGILGLMTRRICVKKNIPFTTTYHTHLPLYAKVRFNILFNITYSYVHYFHKKAQKTFVSTESLKKELEVYKFKNLVLTPFGVDSTLFTKNTKSNIAKLEKPIFVYLGRIAIEKNIEDFLRCNLPGTKLIIGDGPDRLMLQKKYNKDTIFVGYQKGQDLVDYLSLSDVFVFPSRTDTFGLVILEALSCGLPVAAYNVTGPKDIITNGKDGYLGDNLEEIAKKCLNLSPIDCRQKALSYSWESYVNIFIKNNYKIK